MQRVPISDLCAATGAVVHTDKHICSDNDGNFKITCPGQHVIGIRSAEVVNASSISDLRCDHINNLKKCNLSAWHLHDIVMACNERSSCHFSQDLFKDPRCSTPKHGNVARVTYDCINRKWKCLWFQYYCTFLLHNNVFCLGLCRNRSFQTVNVCKTELWVIQQNR